MKITHALSSVRAGEETMRVCTLLAGLSSAFDIRLIAPERADALRILRGTRVKLVPLKIKEGRSFSLTDVYKIRNVLSLDTPHVLHSHASLSARLAARLCGVPFLISERTGKGRKTHAGSFLSGIYNSLTEITVSPSDSVTRQLITEGVPKDRIAHIECGVGEAEAVCLKTGETDVFTVAFRVSRAEEIRLFASALVRILKRMEIRAQLFCDEDLRQEAERLVSAFGLAGCTRIFSSECGSSEFFSVSLFVYLNSEDDTLPLEAMRFMSSSVPIAVALTPRNRDFFSEDENAVFFLPFDPFSLSSAVCRVLSDKVLYERLSSGARQAWESRYTSAAMIEEYARLYRALENVSNVKA